MESFGNDPVRNASEAMDAQEGIQEVKAFRVTFNDGTTALARDKAEAAEMQRAHREAA